MCGSRSRHRKPDIETYLRGINIIGFRTTDFRTMYTSRVFFLSEISTLIKFCLKNQASKRSEHSTFLKASFKLFRTPEEAMIKFIENAILSVFTIKMQILFWFCLLLSVDRCPIVFLL